MEDIDVAILAVCVTLAKGMNKDELVRMVKEEQKAGNLLDGLITKLHLRRNYMTLMCMLLY